MLQFSLLLLDRSCWRSFERPWFDLLPLRRFRLAFFRRFEMAIQAIEARLPVFAVALRELGDLLERAGLKSAGPALRVASAADQSGAFQHFQMLGDGR